ncbi:hypothetical protein [Mycetohabitans rhizoxinica]|uniref:Transposase n=1 Tax=Mycetohabitans rhizoxinica TaxID=412963 RepID=A0ABZ2PWI8_9BURK
MADFERHGELRENDALAILNGNHVTLLVPLDSVKQNGRFTDNYLGRSTGMIVGGYSAMVVAPSL